MTSPDQHSSGKRHIVFVAPSAWALLRSRNLLLHEISSRGHDVLCIAPSFTENDKAMLGELGAKCESIELELPGLKMFADRKIVATLEKAISGWSADAVLGFGGRAMVFSALAARRAGIKRIVSLVNGLPEYGLRPSGNASGLAARHYTQAFKSSQTVVFHNRDDLARLTRLGVLPAGVKSIVVPGAGVDLERNPMLSLPAASEGLVFLMIARMERTRGAGEFVSAAREVKARAPSARFLLAGPAGSSDDAVIPDALGAEGGLIEYLGELADVRPALARAHVFVYPSRTEGMPRAVQEALAAGRPVIAANVAGSRETVDERVNGCLFEPGNASQLAEAMESFLKRPDLIPAMARASRIKAERRFDAREINAVLLDVLGIG